MIEVCPRCGLDHPGWQMPASLDACLFALRQAIVRTRPAQARPDDVPDPRPPLYFRRFSVARFINGRLARIGTFVTIEVAWRQLHRDKQKRTAKGQHPLYVIYQRGHAPWLPSLERKKKRKEQKAA